jgi:hypothetical protein
VQAVLTEMPVSDSKQYRSPSRRGVSVSAELLAASQHSRALAGRGRLRPALCAEVRGEWRAVQKAQRMGCQPRAWRRELQSLHRLSIRPPRERQMVHSSMSSKLSELAAVAVAANSDI